MLIKHNRTHKRFVIANPTPKLEDYETFLVKLWQEKLDVDKSGVLM